jgi:AAA+ ATPase superfamily predicted ATPase
MLKFYNRENEIALLKSIEQKSRKSAQMTFVVGRRRIGKTALLTSVFSQKKSIYFFVEKKNEALLCEEYIEYEKTAIIAEVKRNRKKINMNILQKKAVNLAKKLSGYKVKFYGLSIEDM